MLKIKCGLLNEYPENMLYPIPNSDPLDSIQKGSGMCRAHLCVHDKFCTGF